MDVEAMDSEDGMTHRVVAFVMRFCSACGYCVSARSGAAAFEALRDHHEHVHGGLLTSREAS